MSAERDGKLRETLQSWNEQQQLSARSLEELRNRIRSASREHGQSVSAVEVVAADREKALRGRGQRGREWVYMAIAASMVSVFVGGWGWFMEGVGRNRKPQYADLVMDERSELAEWAEWNERALEPSRWSDPKLASEWVLHFGNRLEWMAEDADRVWVKTGDRSRLEGECYALRLELYKRGEEDGKGVAKAHWAMDFLIEEQSQVEIEGDENSRQVMVWPHRLEDGQVVLEVEFSDGAGEGRKQAWTSIIPLDRTGYGGMVQRMGNWELRQSLVVLDTTRLLL